MPHTFGGNWTDKKLAVVERYFDAYARALKNQHFERWYIDAFAGTGVRMSGQGGRTTGPSLLDEDEADVQATKEGSARLALAIDPAFQRYVFIDASMRRLSGAICSSKAAASRRS